MAIAVGRGGFEPPKSKDSGFTVRPIWPLWNLPDLNFGILELGNFGIEGHLQFPNWQFRNFKIPWSHLSESNQRPTDYKSVALPAELKWHIIP